MKICRLCATQHENVMELFCSESEPRDKLVQTICQYLGLKCQDDNILPNWLCAACQLEAESTEKFLLLVQRGQQKLENMFNVYKNVYEEQENIQKLPETLSENIVIKNLKKKANRVRKCKIKTAAKEAIQATAKNDTEVIHSKRLRRPPKRLIDEIEDQSKNFRSSTSTVITNENEDNACAIITSQPIAELRSSAGVPLAEIIEIEPTKNNSNNQTKYYNKVLLICEYCKEAFGKESIFLKHLEMHQNSIYQCAQCLESFALKPEFDQHQKEQQHIGLGIIENLNAVKISTNKNTNLPDATINIVVGTNGQITSIDSTHLNVANIEEVPNEAEFVNKIIDENEREGKINNKYNPNKLNKLNSQFACLKCQKAFNDQYAVRRHYNQVHIAKRAYKCNQCDANFKNKPNYAYHLTTHTGQKFHKCEQCQKSFILKHQLTLHMRVHSGVKPFQCDKCNKTFTHRSNLVVHQRLHTGLRPFKCEKCESTFNSSSHYKKHQQMHLKQAMQLIKQQIESENIQQESSMHNLYCINSNEQISTQTFIAEKAHSIIIPKKSNIINFNNSTQSLLKQNLKANTVVKKSNKSTINQLDERPQITRVDILPSADIVCNSTKVGNEKELQTHTLSNKNSSAHALKAIYKFQCHNCLKYFKQKSTLTKHMRTHTGEKPYKCPSCPKCFTDPSNFKKHKILHKNATDELKNVTAKMRQIKTAKQNHTILHSPTHSEAASDPDPDGLETLQRVQMCATECSNYSDENHGVDDVSSFQQELVWCKNTSNSLYPVSESKTHSTVNANINNQLVCISYQDPTNPVDNKMTTFYVVN